MKIFVTGLCLQGNKGGPAIALALMKQLKKYIPKADFIFSVPSGEEFQYEIPWSKKYEVEIVEDYSTRGLLPPFVLRNFLVKKQKIKTWFKELSKADLVIEMSAISYVGYPIGSLGSVLLSSRFRYFLSVLFLKKLFLAWTQSYGPLSPKTVQFLARLDLRRQPIIFCRGDDCLAGVKNLLPQKKAFSFPDVATVLDYNSHWGTDYLKTLYQNLNFEKLVTLSPSAVMFRRTNKYTGANKHIKDMVNLCRYLLEKGFFVILVPHTLRPNRPNPEICDYAVSLQVLGQFKDISNIAVIHEDLSPVDLKSIISTAYVHIGARYHSIVASLSSGVPAIALSWHPKYKDIMQMYGVQDYVYDGVNSPGINDLFFMFNTIDKNRTDINKRLILAHSKVQTKVEENSRIFANIIKGPSHDL